MRPSKVKLFFKRKANLIYVLAKYILIVTLVGFVVFYVFNYPAFKVSGFTQTGIDKFVNVSDFEKVVSANVLSKNIFLVDAKDLENKLKQIFLGLRTIEVYKKFPSKIVITTQERIPIAIVKDVNASKFLVDLDGYVLGVIEDGYFDLPSVDLKEEIRVGQFIDQKIVPIATDLIDQAKIENVRISSISFEGSTNGFYLPQDVRVLFSLDKDARNVIQIVAKLLSETAAEGKNIAKIDLRYDKVIVSFK